MRKNIEQNNSLNKTEKFDVSKQIERNKEILDTINGWINVADSKVSIFCGVFSVVFAVMVFIAENFLSKRKLLENNCPFWVNATIVLICFSILTFFASLVFSFNSVSPKLTKIDDKRKGEYSIFYAQISEFENSKEYVNCAKKATDEMYNEELLNEIYINSGVCTQKMCQFRLSLWLSFGSIIAAILSGLIFLLISK